MHLLRSDQPISIDTGRYELVDTRCQFDRYSDFDVAVASIFMPSGPLLAGRYGIGLLQLSGLTPEGMAVLPKHWETVEKTAADHGTEGGAGELAGSSGSCTSPRPTIERSKTCASASTTTSTTSRTPSAARATRRRERRSRIDSSGRCPPGTHSWARPTTRSRSSRSSTTRPAGTSGAFLFWAQEWASPAATPQSYELFARDVMPVFQGTTNRMRTSHKSPLRRCLPSSPHGEPKAPSSSSPSTRTAGPVRLSVGAGSTRTRRTW